MFSEFFSNLAFFPSLLDPGYGEILCEIKLLGDHNLRTDEEESDNSGKVYSRGLSRLSTMTNFIKYGVEST